MDYYDSSQLKGKGRCRKLREHALKLDGGNRKNSYGKAVLEKSIIKDAVLSGSWSEEGINQRLEEGFKELSYPTNQTKEAILSETKSQILRYLKSETRDAYPCPVKMFQPFGLCKVSVCPDLMFLGIRNIAVKVGKGKKAEIITTSYPTVEVVKLCCKTPDVTQAGKKQDVSVNYSLELYTMMLYAREVFANVFRNSDGSPKEFYLGASYYFLRFPNDSTGFECNFFQNKARNIVTLWEKHSTTETVSGTDEAANDSLFYPQFLDFVDGKEMECDETVCQGCPLYCTCSYTPLPVRITEEKPHKSVADLELSEQQEAAIMFRRGVARINAGAGAGKTMVSALRVAMLLCEGVKPEEICMLTFTTTGAEELQTRAKVYAEDFGCDADVSKLTSMTFHSFGNEVIEKNFRRMGYTMKPHLIDEIERATIITELLKENNISGLDYRNFYMDLPNVRGALSVVKSAFNVIKRDRLGREDSRKLAGILVEERRISGQLAQPGNKECLLRACTELIDLYQDFDRELHNRCLIEYADQEQLVLDLLKNDPHFFDSRGYKHIMVDEFQDTSDAQMEILKHLIDTPSFESFVVVGDDSQSVFSFRGAVPENIIRFFKKTGKEGEDFYLLENYRSTPEIVDFVNKINALNENRIEKDLIAVRPNGKPVSVERFSSHEEEYEYAVDIIRQKKEEGYLYEDIAFIAYSKDELQKMGEKCRAAGIPVIMLNPELMLQNPLVNAALGLADFIRDNTDSLRAFEYLIGLHGNALLKKTDEEIFSEIESLKGVAASLMRLPLPERKDRFFELLAAVSPDPADELYEDFLASLHSRRDLEEILEYMAAYREYGAGERRRRRSKYPGVTLITAHSSKGMEWPVVINSVTKYCGKEMKDIEERRRLFFVSASRAKDELFVTGQTDPHGSQAYNQFLQESFQVLGLSEAGQAEEPFGPDSGHWAIHPIV